MLGRAVSLNIAGQLGGFVVSFASAIMLARLLGPSDRGLLAIMITVATVMVALAGVGLATSAQYFASRAETRQSALLGNSLLFGIGLAVLAIPLFFVLREPLSAWFGHGRGNLVWVLAGLLSRSSSSTARPPGRSAAASSSGSGMRCWSSPAL